MLVLLALASPAWSAGGFGRLTQLPGRDGCVKPFGERTWSCSTGWDLGGALAVTPNGRFLYSAGDSGLGGYRVGWDGSLRRLPPPGGCLTPVGTELDVRGCTGTDLARSVDLKSSPDGRHLYSVEPTYDSLTTFALDNGGGLREAGCLYSFVARPYPGENCVRASEVEGITDVVVSGDGRNVYAATEGPRVVALRRDALTGRLTPLQAPGACFSVKPTELCPPIRGLLPSGRDVHTLAISDDGRNVYLAARRGVAVFRRAGDGSLSQLSGRLGCLGIEGRTCGHFHVAALVTSMLITPDGGAMYVL